MFNLPRETEITPTILQILLDKHKREVNKRYLKLKKAYESDHDILYAPDKPAYKPDNRIVINFSKYIVDTMNGYFIGNPIKVLHDEANVSEFVEYIDKYNSQDDNNSEISKTCSIYGRAYELYYADEEAKLSIAYLSPTEAFMVFDDSIIERPLFFVRRYTDKDNTEWGSISDEQYVRNFKITGGIKWIDDWHPHYFDGVPATEFVENEERQGLFEPVMTIINAYDKAISEKANDVDYFADAYLKILGSKVESDDIRFIRDSRVINLYGEFGDDASSLVAEFMDKPSSDTTQENLLDRLERLIFQISMVANVSDENFGTSSGIALKYKLQAMSNLEKTKERKFTKGMNRRYKLLFSHPSSKVGSDSWVGLKYKFTPNIPANVLEETQIVGGLEGIVSKETQLKALSLVESVKDELTKLEEENIKPANDIVDKMMFNKTDDVTVDNVSTSGTEVQSKQLNGAQTQSLLSIISQFAAGALSEGQAINLIATSVGINKEDARKILNGEL